MNKLGKRLIHSALMAMLGAALVVPLFQTTVSASDPEWAKIGRKAGEKSDKEAKQDGFSMDGKIPATKLGKKSYAKVLTNQSITPKAVRLAYRGYIYRNRHLSYASHLIVNYNVAKFMVNRQETVLHHGSQSVYYHVVGPVTGWVWHKNTLPYKHIS